MEDYIRYDITVKNSTNNDIDAVFNETRLNSLPVKDPMKYNFIIEQFALPLNTLPLMICPVQLGQVNPDMTPWNVTIKSIGGNTYTQNVAYQPALDTDKQPAYPLTKQDLSTKYYWVMSYSSLLVMINDAIAGAFQDWYTTEGISVTYIAPRLAYDKDTKSFYIICPYQMTRQQGFFFLGFNYPLQLLMEGFPIKKQSTSNVYYLDINYNIDNGYALPGSTIPPYGTPPAYIKSYQDYSAIRNINSLRKIIMTSPSFGISGETISGENGTDNTLDIITDYTPAIELAGDQKSVLYYYPNGPYRKIDILSNSKIQNIFIKVYWKDISGNIFDLKIPPYNSMHIKLLFMRKGSEIDKQYK